MEEVNSAVKEAFKTGSSETVVEVLKAQYEKHREFEGPAGWVAGVIGEKGVEPLFPLLRDFIERYPVSLYSVRVLWADYLASREQFDEAAEHARIYLRQAKDQGKFPQLAGLRIIKDGVSRAFAILMVPYAMVGAKSYAKRVLGIALSLDLDEFWKSNFRESLVRIDADLEKEEDRALDAKWETFFSSAGHVTELYQRCGEMGFPNLGKRVDLIEGFFRTTRDYKADEREMFLVPMVGEAPSGAMAWGLI